MPKVQRYQKTIKDLIKHLKFKKVTQKKVIEAYLNFLESKNKPLPIVTEKDIISTIRHDFSNYRELYLILHQTETAHNIHRKFRNKVNGIIREKFEYILKG